MRCVTKAVKKKFVPFGNKLFPFRADPLQTPLSLQESREKKKKKKKKKKTTAAKLPSVLSPI